jgi:AcrR family transcriptional regulator
MSSRLPVAQRRSQLVEAALEVAAAQGIAATTVRRVAEHAGVALGVVHYCFADKDELVSEVAARIVERLAETSVAGLAQGDLDAALRAAVAALWADIEATPGEQLLTYEITTHALRTRGMANVATRQYEVSQAAAMRLLDEAAAATSAMWNRPVSELAAEALAFLDGVTLRWLVERDGAAARRRLDAFAGYLAGQAASGRRE